MLHDLSGRSAIISGASQGLGLAIARAYVAAGASVLICARDAATLKNAGDELIELAGDAGRVVSEVADVASESDVARIVDRAASAFGKIDVLVNNAGVYGPLGALEEVDWKEWAQAIEINLLGSVLLCREVLPSMKRQGRGKIVQLSGGGATNPLPRISAYAASKAAIVRFAETLAEEVREHHIDVNAIAPGPLNTRLLDEGLAAGPERVGESFFAELVRQKETGGAGFEAGASLAVFLGSPASDGITGKLISAIWDPWSEFPEHRDDLNSTDIYTLRRIVPKDRKLSWGNDSNVAIVGCGLVGQKRASAIGRARLVACCDEVIERAAVLASAHGAAVVDHWHNIMTRDDVDIVIVATTNEALAPITLAAIEARKHVLVEKPGARSTGELDVLIEAAARHGVRVRVGFNHRYHPALLQARDLVDLVLAAS